MPVIAFVTALSLFIFIMSKVIPKTAKLERTQDGDYQRGIPQKDITGHGHEEQMFAVKVPSTYSSFLFCGSESCSG